MLSELFLATLAYPAALSVIVIGCGLLVDRVGGRTFPTTLIPPLGFALVVCASQLLTWSRYTARLTPYALVVLAAVGLGLSLRRFRQMLLSVSADCWPALAVLATYLVAIAPVILAARPTLTGYLLDTTSATHLIGADYLLHHGRSFATIPTTTSYGGYLHGYFGTNYPSGGHTAFGATASLVPVGFIWLYQPYLAVLVALTACPLAALAKQVGLDRALGALATLTCCVPALVYAYELVGSIKELAALPMIITTGALVSYHRTWLPTSRGAVALGLVAAAGLGAIGIAFAAWILASAWIVVLLTAAAVVARERRPGQLLAALATGALTIVVGALPLVWHFSASLRGTRGIAVTSDQGNLLQPLAPVQALGVWIGGPYREDPIGHRLLTYTLIGVVLAAAVYGGLSLARSRHKPLFCWVASLALLWWVLSTSGSTWTDAKLILLSSSLAVFLAWVAVASLLERGQRVEAALLAAVIAGGILYSDAEQYHVTNLAPTDRFDELSRIGHEFSHRGPTLVPDFDEYALFLLRSMSVSGPGFAFKPVALAAAHVPYGYPADLDRLTPASYAEERLIVMRRDPLASRPPATYQLVKQTRWYEVWRRPTGAMPPIAHLPLQGKPGAVGRARCSDVRKVASKSKVGELVAAKRPDVLTVPAERMQHSPGWSAIPAGLRLQSPGVASHTFELPYAGDWRLWVQGQFGRELRISVDGLEVAKIAPQTGELGNFAEPVNVRLSRGRHRVTLARGGGNLRPGDGAYTELNSVVLQAGYRGSERLVTARPREYHRLCNLTADWIEGVEGQTALKDRKDRSG